jgi:hypothetical protein
MKNYLDIYLKFLDSSKKNHNYDKIKKMITTKSSINNLITKSKNDVCWRLYKNNIDENLLIRCLKNENY